MTKAKLRKFLREPRVGVLAVNHPKRGPVAVPMWFEYRHERLWMAADPHSLKARLLRRAQRASLTVQDERLPYCYVAIEGPVEFGDLASEAFVRRLALHYLGKREGARYMRRIYPTFAGQPRLVVLTPEHVTTVDGVLSDLRPTKVSSAGPLAIGLSTPPPSPRSASASA